MVSLVRCCLGMDSDFDLKRFVIILRLATLPSIQLGRKGENEKEKMFTCLATKFLK